MTTRGIAEGSEPGVDARSAFGPGKEGLGQASEPKVWVRGATLALCLLLLAACGRTASRIGGKGARQVLEVPGEFISISFDKRGSSTVKDVTFLAPDGFIYTQEFKDVSPLEGVIRWVPHGTGSDFIQSRRFSRWTGGAVDLELPEDCAQVLAVDIGYSEKNERVKNVTYRSTDGAIYSREYREGLIDRNFEGWLEIRTKD